MKIVCIGRNFVDHIKELNNLVPDEPVIFIKPDNAVLKDNVPFFIPNFSNDVHHEVELVVKITKVGKCIPLQFAKDYFKEITVGIDFTARDLQQKLKDKGLPWEKAKGFDNSAAIGEFISIEGLDIENLDFGLQKNGDWVQRGNSNQMIHSIYQIISHVSEYFTLKVGDLIFTGTPAGVGRVSPNDNLKGYIGNQLLFDFNIK